MLFQINTPEKKQSVKSFAKSRNMLFISPTYMSKCKAQACPCKQNCTKFDFTWIRTLWENTTVIWNFLVLL